VLQDLIGPLTVFNILRCEIHLVWKNREPVMSEVGLPVTPSTLFRDCPDNLDVLFAPGGLEGTIAMMEDPEVLQFFADRGRTARYVTSDCTGSLLLGAAGLLRGYKAASHWSVRDHLALLGATPVHERVVQDRNRITGGGVTAGIDFGLTLAALLRNQAEAESIQLIIEYAPAPPFNAGTPETAPKAIVDRIVALRSPMWERTRQTALRAAEKFKA
jgi:cyclohexyl-isocyanide hydratase